MPLPFILGGVAAAAGTVGVVKGVKGAKKAKEANDTMKLAERKQKENINKFETTSKKTYEVLDNLGKYELQILKGFEEFSDTVEKIQNRPEFVQYNKEGVELPKYDKEELKKVSVGAGALLGGLSGAALGTAGGFAAAGATTSAVMALGTASTGTAISTLSGAALTNATLAALGGGAIGSVPWAGGMALGSTILGAATLGVGLMVGGLIFDATGNKLSSKANEAYNQMKEAEKSINRICYYLNDLKGVSNCYRKSLEEVHNAYKEYYSYLSYTVNRLNKTEWSEFTEAEKMATENTVLLVGLLYKMCQVNLVEKAENKKDLNKVNHSAVDESIKKAKVVLKDIEGKNDKPAECFGVKMN